MPNFIISPQLSIYYVENNPSGRRPVILLHGLGVNGSSWQLQIPSLVDVGFRVISPDVRGFGESTYPGGKTSIHTMSEDIVKLLASLQIGQSDVVGISMGGTIALQLAIDHPELVRKLVLVNTFAHLRPDSLSGWFYFATRLGLIQLLGLRAQAQVVSRRLFPMPEQEELRQLLITQIMQADPRGYRAAMRALWDFNVTNRLGSLNIPTLIITGDADTTVPLRIQQHLSEGIPNARQVFIHQAGHAVTVEQPTEFNQALLQFLNPSPA
jgi:pimeloyl-ACP methyl ester carboxylesterase